MLAVCTIAGLKSLNVDAGEQKLPKELWGWGSIDRLRVPASSSSVSPKMSASSVSVQRATTGRPCPFLFVSPAVNSWHLSTIDYEVC